MPETVYWENNTCGYCGIKTEEPLEKLTCSGDQQGVQCCRACGFAPEAPENLHLTADYFREKLSLSIGRTS